MLEVPCMFFLIRISTSSLDTTTENTSDRRETSASVFGGNSFEAPTGFGVNGENGTGIKLPSFGHLTSTAFQLPKKNVDACDRYFPRFFRIPTNCSTCLISVEGFIPSGSRTDFAHPRWQTQALSSPKLSFRNNLSPFDTSKHGVWR